MTRSRPLGNNARYCVAKAWLEMAEIDTRLAQILDRSVSLSECYRLIGLALQASHRAQSELAKVMPPTCGGGGTT